MKYCFLCFNWFVEKKWEEHCKSHLKCLALKRCGPITYCGTLVRPGFCPFCTGNETLDAVSRLGSWTRETKLRDHIRSHLRGACWPHKCPFPLCNLQLNVEKSFLYHLNDVHGIGMGRSTKDSKPDGTTNRFIDWNSDLISRKRKREESDSGNIDLSVEEVCIPDSKTPILVQTVSPHSLSITLPSDTSLPDTQELLHPRQISLPDTAIPSLDDAMNLPEIEPDVTALDDDSLFSTFLRSRSSSYFLEQKDSNNEALHLQSSPMQDVCTPMNSDPSSAESIERGVMEIPDSPPRTKKPRIIMRLRPPEIKAKPKLILQVKKLEVKSSVKQSKKGIFKKGPESHIGSEMSQKRPRSRRQSHQSANHGNAAVELRATVSRQTRIGREIKPTKKAVETGKQRHTLSR